MCNVQYVLCGTVILFKTDDLCSWKVSLKLIHVTHVSTPETINALVRQTGGRERLSLLAEQ